MRPVVTIAIVQPQCSWRSIPTIAARVATRKMATMIRTTMPTGVPTG